MPNALVLLADGFEEIEAIAVVDVLRRAEIDVTLAGLTSTSVMGAHAICIQADRLLEELDVPHVSHESVDSSLTLPRVFDIVVLPGGMPGSRNLRDDDRVRRVLVAQFRANRLIAAICAAPIALEAAGILKGRSATCYPGVEIPSARQSESRVVVDGNVITSRGPGTALEFALAIVAILTDAGRAERLKTAMLVV